MKNHFKRILALLLVVLVIFSVPVAAENVELPILTAMVDMEPTRPDTTDVTDPTEPTTSPDVTEPTEPTTSPDVTDPTEPTTSPGGESETDPGETELLNFDEIAGDTIVGKMYICSQQASIGHAWVYIESSFNGEMPVGCYTLEPYGGVSVGTFATTRSDGIGVYYNVEAYCAETYGLKNMAWYGTEITKDQLLKANKAILNTNHWDPFFNCTFFAAKVWNRAAKKKIVPFLFPFVIRWQILAKGGTKDIQMKPVTAEQCFKQRKMGSKAYLKQCSAKTLDTRLG